MATEAKYEKKWRKEVGDADTNPNSFLDELDKAVKETSAYRPPDAITTVEFAARYKLTKSRATTALEKLVTNGKMTKHYSGGKVFYLMVKG